MTAVRMSETSIAFYRTVLPYYLEDSTFNSYLYENLESNTEFSNIRMTQEFTSLSDVDAT
jgi:hypothetical protein